MRHTSSRFDPGVYVCSRALLQGEGARDVEVERSAALLLEAFVMHGLKHPKIVSLVAVCTHAKPIIICMEHMRNGDLRTFLRR